jgi:hypothetical protein
MVVRDRLLAGAGVTQRRNANRNRRSSRWWRRFIAVPVDATEPCRTQRACACCLCTCCTSCRVRTAGRARAAAAAAAAACSSPICKQPRKSCSKWSWHNLSLHGVGLVGWWYQRRPCRRSLQQPDVIVTVCHAQSICMYVSEYKTVVYDLQAGTCLI